MCIYTNNGQLPSHQLDTKSYASNDPYISSCRSFLYMSPSLPSSYQKLLSTQVIWDIITILTPLIGFTVNISKDVNILESMQWDFRYCNMHSMHMMDYRLYSDTGPRVSSYRYGYKSSVCHWVDWVHYAGIYVVH